MSISAAKRHKRPIALLLIDIDEFKGINTTHGHELGDEALRVIAARLNTHIRTEDSLGRWGGEEFLVVLPDTSPDVAFAAAERLRHAVATEPIQLGETPVTITISLGAVGVPDEPDRDALLNAADTALTRAKAAGRNRTEII